MIRTLAQILAGLPDNNLREITALNSREIAEGSFGAFLPGAPTPNDDNLNTAGNGFFDSRSWWQDSTNGDVWYCQNGTPTAASWVLIYPQGGLPTIVDAVAPIHSVFDGIQTYTISYSSFPPAGPSPAPMPLVWLKRNGPFWQDVLRTIPAISSADEVRTWDDSSGNAFHLQTYISPADYNQLLPNAQAGFAAIKSSPPSRPIGCQMRSGPTGAGNVQPFTFAIAFRYDSIAGSQGVADHSGFANPMELALLAGVPTLRTTAGAVPYAAADTNWHTLLVEVNAGASTYSFDGGPKTGWVANTEGGLNYITYWGSFFFGGLGLATIGEGVYYERILSSADYAATASYISAWLGSPVGPGPGSINAGTNVVFSGPPTSPTINVPAIPVSDLSVAVWNPLIIVPPVQVGPGYLYSDLSGAPAPNLSGPIFATTAGTWATLLSISSPQAICGNMVFKNVDLAHGCQFRWTYTDFTGSHTQTIAGISHSSIGFWWNVGGTGGGQNSGGQNPFTCITSILLEIEDDILGNHADVELDYGLTLY